MLDTLIERRINTFETSSCGRLFDAVAALVGLHQVVSFEGQAAMTLEAIADNADEAYDYAVCGHVPLQVDMRPMVLQIVDEVKRGESASRISARFHNTMAAVVGDISERVRQSTGLSRVCMSGGCFQNQRLLQLCLASHRANDFEVYCQRLVPTNDGGIALGQAAIVSEMLRRGA